MCANVRIKNVTNNNEGTDDEHPTYEEVLTNKRSTVIKPKLYLEVASTLH